MKKTKLIIMILLFIILLGAIGYVVYGIYQNATMEVKNPIVTMNVKDMGTVKIELYPEQAPNTVANFIALIQRGFYNGLTFHRTIPDFMIQGGDKNGDGTGSPTLKDLKDDGDDTAYSINGEFIANKVNNTIHHERGVISMARADYSSIGLTEEGYNSAGSQFFITTAEQTSLDGLYAAFGKVIEGMEVVDAISNVEVVTRDETAEEGLDKPVNPPVIESMTVETFGVDYGLPETHKAFNYSEWFYETYGIDPNTLAGSTEEE